MNFWMENNHFLFFKIIFRIHRTDEFDYIFFLLYFFNSHHPVPPKACVWVEQLTYMLYGSVITREQNHTSKLLLQSTL